MVLVVDVVAAEVSFAYLLQTRGAYQVNRSVCLPWSAVASGRQPCGRAAASRIM
jgi:hypothetical protein